MSHKTKNIVLVVGFFLGLVLCHKLAFSKTLDYKRQYAELSQQEQLFANTPHQLSVLKQKQRYFDSILSAYQLKGSSLQNGLLSTINTFANDNGLKVIGFLEPHTFMDNDLTVKTYQITLEGDYNAMLDLIFRLEQRTKFGEIINLHFEKKKDFRTGKSFLQAHILLRSLG
jgi:hypothetical protein